MKKSGGKSSAHKKRRVPMHSPSPKRKPYDPLRRMLGSSDRGGHRC